MTPSPMRVALVGCGAIAEMAHAPALRVLAAEGRVRVAALIDPSVARRAVVARLLPEARSLERLEALAAGEVDLAIVASPVSFHAEQSIRLLRDGAHVLVEKPIATTVADAEAMVEAARVSRRALAVGLFRRHFPALNEIGHLITSGTYGALRRFEVEEGGSFGWPAATPALFDPKLAGGGVLIDVGAHVLDVLVWWLGEPASVRYADDAAGGVEMNCRVELGYAASANTGAVEGSVRLSRDWRTANLWTLEFERATVVWQVGEANRISLRARGSHYWAVAELERESLAIRLKGDTYQQCFTRQIVDLLDCLAAGRPPRVAGAEALRSLRLIERCYRERQPWPTDQP